ncbi:putative ABC transporter substrate binding protein [Brevibacillus brevis NBRC 100599]|uniref:Putative ABC transporter substrate binding protein n=1 Tax=Brevibacillus brevis (strain 47 / JCM 6285 / NBRC 100599) TaxID=358681 RepID=C0Z8S5_BREBN|nr:putative ABC transporter substrate binding protein [Brevibacillus brevis NBRC 100599]
MSRTCFAAFFCDGTSLEKVLAMNPDLLIVFEGDQNIEQFTKIAPTVVIPYAKKSIREEKACRQ